MISTSKKFIFIHIPKTGGNSIQSILKEYSDDNITTYAKHQEGIERFEIENNKYSYNKHSNLTEYKKELEPELYKSMLKFTVVRNPWDRMVSYYFSPHRGKEEFDIKEFKILINKIPVLGFYTTELSKWERIKYRGRMLDKTKNGLDSDIDFYLRFEKLDEDFKVLCNRLEIPFKALPQYNKSNKNHYSSYYNQELKSLVGRKFREEIKFFNYRFEEE